jgi:hypothetical protein
MVLECLACLAKVGDAAVTGRGFLVDSAAVIYEVKEASVRAIVQAARD